jgi:predicted transcriptional regulator
MRLHIELDDDVVKEIDGVAGARGRSRFKRAAIGSPLEHHRQRALIRSARGSIGARGHAWDEDAAGWVRAQRRIDRRKVG